MRYLLPVMLLVLFSCRERQEVRLQNFLLKGNLALKEGNEEQSLYYFEEALKLDPCFADAANNKGTVFYRQKRYDKALLAYEQAVQCRPDFLNAYFNRANTLYEMKEYFGALADLDRVIRQKPDTALAHFTKGVVLVRMHDYPAAIRSFDRAIQLDGQKVEYLVNRAIVKFYQRDYENAKKELLEASKVNDREPNIWNTLALIEIEYQRNLPEKSRDYHDAFSLIDHALRLAPNQPYYLNNRGYLYLVKGDLERAENDINESITRDPYNGWAYRNKGIFYLMKNNPGSAERLFRQAAKMDADIDEVYLYLGKALRANGKDDEACQAFREAVKHHDGEASELIKHCKRS